MANTNLDGIRKKDATTVKIKPAENQYPPKKIDGLQPLKKIADIPIDISESEEAENEEKILNIKTAETRAKKDKLKKIAANFFASLKKIFTGLYSGLKLLCKEIAFTLLIAVLCLGLLYAAYAALLIRFNFNNTFSRLVNSYIFVPAVISDKGSLSYEEYISVINEVRKSNLPGPTPITIERKLYEKIIVNYLDRKYSINADQPGDKKLDGLVLKDDDINYVGLSRINKIKELMDKGGNFDDVFSKYGDYYSDGENISKNDALKKFNNDLSGLGVNQTSPILYGDNGYYIVKMLENKNDIADIKYVFVRGKTIYDYITEEAGKIKMLRLIN